MPIRASARNSAWAASRLNGSSPAIRIGRNVGLGDRGFDLTVMQALQVLDRAGGGLRQADEAPARRRGDFSSHLAAPGGLVMAPAIEPAS